MKHENWSSLRDYIEILAPFVCWVLFAFVLFLSLSGLQKRWSKYLFPSILFFAGLGPPLGAITLLIVGERGPSFDQPQLSVLQIVLQTIFAMILLLVGSYGEIPPAFMAGILFGLLASLILTSMPRSASGISLPTAAFGLALGALSGYLGGLTWSAIIQGTVPSILVISTVAGAICGLATERYLLFVRGNP
jgi:hypothetical protein